MPDNGGRRASESEQRVSASVPRSRAARLGIIAFACVTTSVVAAAVALVVSWVFSPEDGGAHGFALLNPFGLLVTAIVTAAAGALVLPVALITLRDTELERSIPFVMVVTLAAAAISAPLGPGAAAATAGTGIAAMVVAQIRWGGAREGRRA